MCHTHNAYLAELDYGKEVMEKYRSGGDRVSETAFGLLRLVSGVVDRVSRRMRTRDA